MGPLKSMSRFVRGKGKETHNPYVSGTENRYYSQGPYNRNAGELVSNFMYSTGDAQAYVLNDGSPLAMAKGPSGAASAYMDGNRPRIQFAGNGRAGIQGDTAWATAGPDNVAVAISATNQKNGNRRRGGKQAITEPQPWRALPENGRQQQQQEGPRIGGGGGREVSSYYEVLRANQEREFEARRRQEDWRAYGQEAGYIDNDEVEYDPDDSD